MQAIQTKYLPCTNHRPSRVKAWCAAGSVTLSWDNEANVEGNHAFAARTLARKMGWYGRYVGGSLPSPSSDGYAFVRVSRFTEGEETPFTCNRDEFLATP